MVDLEHVEGPQDGLLYIPEVYTSHHISNRTNGRELWTWNIGGLIDKSV